MTLSKPQIKQLVKEYFSYLNSKEADLFISISQYEVFKNKELILKSDRLDKYLFLILKGCSRAYFINDNGHELNCHLRAEGYFFGDARVFENIPQILNAEAIGETHILKFNVEELESIGYKNHKIMLFYVNILKEIISALSHRTYTFVSMTPKERYIDLIKQNPMYLKTTFDKHIATFLGIKPLTLHRIKKSL